MRRTSLRSPRVRNHAADGRRPRAGRAVPGDQAGAPAAAAGRPLGIRPFGDGRLFKHIEGNLYEGPASSRIALHIAVIGREIPVPNKNAQTTPSRKPPAASIRISCSVSPMAACDSASSRF